MPTRDKTLCRRSPPRFVMHTLAIAAVLQLASCGGGGTGLTLPIQASDELKGTLISGTGSNTTDWDPATCTDSRQKSWVRANLNEDYLFYREAPLSAIEPTTFADSVIKLFEAYTVDGLPQKDRFSFVTPQAKADAAFHVGVSTDIGATLVRDPATNQIRIAFVDPNGPAFAAGLRRGMQLKSVNNTVLPTSENQPVLSAAQFDAMFASSAGSVVTVGVTTPPATTETLFSLTIASFSETPVLMAKVLDATAAPGKVGYLAHNSFVTPIAETQLADAFKTFATAGVTDLVVDLRYNTGGYIFIASQLAYMVAGNARSTNKTFEAFVYNDKRRAENQSEPFRSVITDFRKDQRIGEALSQLNLNRVFVLATGNTCSASEAFVNGLRGVDVEVVMIGSTTCGKPYGSSQENNCALSFFPLEFEGRNHKGQAVPVTGLTPTASCTLSDDLNHELGDPSERMLSSSISYMVNGACAATTASATALGQPRKPGALIEEQEFVSPHRTLQLRLKPR